LESACRQASGEDVEAVKFADLKAEFPALRPPVVEGIAREGETVNVIGGPKVGKSWLGYGLALSIANGVQWLGRFPTRRGPVLLIDNELHPETLVARIGGVAAAMKLGTDDVSVVSLRGRGMDYDTLAARIGRLARRGQHAAIIVDAHYRMLPPGTSENDNTGITKVYDLIDRMAEETGSAWFLIHHTSKGEQIAKSTTDVGAGAGAQSRAADAHLVVRTHTNKETKETSYLMAGAVRSFPPLFPAVLRWNHPIWSADPKLTGEQTEALLKDLKRSAARDKVFGALKKLGGARSLNEVQAAVGFAKERCRELLNELVGGGRVTTEEVNRSGNRTRAYSAVS
jgi:RecA-family ATPase